MNSPKHTFFGITLLLLFFAHSVLAQDSIPPKKEKIYHNTIRYNASNPLIFGSRSVIFGYERTVGKYKSFCINIGQAALNKPSGYTSEKGEATLQKKVEDRGFHISGDFRFYLKKQNKFIAPHGIYIGPYYGYNYFQRQNTWTLTTKNFSGTLGTKYTLDLHTAGFELGYQFVFWKRVTLDMVLFGPGVSIYKFEAELDAKLEQEDREIIFDGLHQMLANRVPGYNILINDNEFRKSGYVRSSTLGFRYVIHVGFRF